MPELFTAVASDEQTSAVSTATTRGSMMKSEGRRSWVKDKEHWQAARDSWYHEQALLSFQARIRGKLSLGFPGTKGLESD